MTTPTSPPQWAMRAWHAAFGEWAMQLDKSVADQAAATELARLCVGREEFERILTGAIEEVEGGRLYEQMCCSGHHCGCQGSSNAELLVWQLRQALEASNGQ